MNGERFARALDRVSQGVLGVFLCVGLLLLGVIMYVVALSPEARAARDFLRRMPEGSIRSIVLEPLPREPKSLSRRSVVITQPDRIHAIATLIHAARPWRPNHPQRQWAMAMRFELQDRTFAGTVVSTYGQGILFYYGLGANGGPVYGTYRQDELGSILAAIVRESAR
jgi:hypothetical protein